jgi:hypothetical protein
VQPVGPAGEDGVHALRVVLVNDMPSKWAANVIVRRIDVHGRTLAEGQCGVLVRPRGMDASIDPFDIVGPPADPRSEGLVVDVPSQDDAIGEEMPLANHDRMRAWWWWAAERDQPEVTPTFEVSMGKSIADRSVQIHARTLVRDLWVEPACDWVECSPNLVSLLPGERAHLVLRVRGSDAGVPVLRMHAH